MPPGANPLAQNPSLAVSDLNSLSKRSSLHVEPRSPPPPSSSPFQTYLAFRRPCHRLAPPPGLVPGPLPCVHHTPAPTPAPAPGGFRRNALSSMYHDTSSDHVLQGNTYVPGIGSYFLLCLLYQTASALRTRGDVFLTQPCHSGSPYMLCHRRGKLRREMLLEDLLYHPGEKENYQMQKLRCREDSKPSQACTAAKSPDWNLGRSAPCPAPLNPTGGLRSVPAQLPPSQSHRHAGKKTEPLP